MTRSISWQAGIISHFLKREISLQECVSICRSHGFKILETGNLLTTRVQGKGKA